MGARRFQLCAVRAHSDKYRRQRVESDGGKWQLGARTPRQNVNISIVAVPTVNILGLHLRRAHQKRPTRRDSFRRSTASRFPAAHVDRQANRDAMICDDDPREYDAIVRATILSFPRPSKSRTTPAEASLVMWVNNYVVLCIRHL